MRKRWWTANLHPLRSCPYPSFPVVSLTSYHLICCLFATFLYLIPSGQGDLEKKKTEHINFSLSSVIFRKWSWFECCFMQKRV